MEGEKKQHIVKYQTYVFILLALITFTGLSVLVTSFNLGPLAVTMALIIACCKTTLVLLIFMHLKFEERIYRWMILMVLVVFLALIIITFLDYSFR